MNDYHLKNIYQWPLPGQILVLGLLALMILFLAYLWDFSGLLNDINKKQEEEKNLKQQFSQVLRKEENLTRDIAKFPDLQHLINEGQRKLITQAAMPELMNEVLQIASKNKLTFTLFDPQTEVKEGNYLKLPIKINALGDCMQIAQFISDVINLPWILLVSDFNLSRPEGKIAQNDLASDLNAMLTLEIYRLAEKIEKTAEKKSANSEKKAHAP